MNQSEVVWVFGAGGSGKETFIRHLVEDKPKDLITLLDWEGKEILACWDSIKLAVQYYGDPSGDRRLGLKTIIPKIALKQNSVTLIKGQYIDFENGTLLKVRKVLPDYFHKVIFLHTDFAELLRRWRTKKWWDDKYTVRTVKQWLETQIEELQSLPDDFQITALDSSDPENYKKIDFPPKI